MADADSSAIADWLESVRAGLGSYASAFLDYGATTTADLCELDEDDIDAIKTVLSKAEGGPLPPLRIKQIVKSLGELKKT